MEDICEEINRKIWTVEQLLSQAGEIVERSKSLSPSKKKEVSVTISDWSEDKVRRHVETVKEAVVYPIRHKNKGKLEKVGVSVEGLLEDVFDDTEVADRIVAFIDSINSIDNQLTSILANERVIERLLKGSPDEIVQKLQDVANAELPIKEILAKEIDTRLRCEFLRRSLDDIGLLEEAGEIVSNIEYLRNFGVLIDYGGEYEEFRQMLNNTSGKIRQIVEEYGVPEDEIGHEISGKTLSKAAGITGHLQNRYAERKRTLLEEWRACATTLKSLGEELPELRQNLRGLQESVNEIGERCLKHLGQSGLKLLKFLRGEGDFPENIEIEEIKKTLIALRPMFLKKLLEDS